MVDEPYRSSRARLVCRSCGHQGTVTAGTIFDKTRTPLRVWLSGAWYVTKLDLAGQQPLRVIGVETDAARRGYKLTCGVDDWHFLSSS